MVTPLALAFLLGVVSGLRTFTAPAVLWLTLHRGPWAYLLGVAALIEYYLDLSPKMGPRTDLPALLARLISGAFVGWWAAVATGGISPFSGAAVGAVGAVAGAYASLPIRRQAIAVIGNYASGLLEDVIAIAASVAIVTHL
jgi:uncharacterized membrane protein